MSKQIKNVLLLLLVAIIWGFAFPVQRIGAEKVAPFTLYAFRCYASVITLLIFNLFSKKPRDKENISYSTKKGIVIGIFSFLAAITQQIGVLYTTASNASFITSTYVIMVPIISMFLGKKTDKNIWFCVALELVGLYLLCIKDNFVINKGDLIMMACAFFYAIQIILIAKDKDADTLVMCLVQFVVCALISTILMLIFEMPIDYKGLNNAIIPILYTGVLSSGLCLTIQVTVQKEIDPTVASIIMCLESVFGALGGWLLLHEVLSTKELIGCAIAFGAIVISQLPTKKDN